MRIEGFVPVDDKGNAFWDDVATTKEDAIRRCCAPGEWYLYEKSGWTVVRVGDVDSLRDEALEEIAEWHDNEAAKTDGRGGQGEVVALVHLAAADDIRAMKSKP